EAKAAPKLVVAKPSGVEVIEPTEIAKAPADVGTQEVAVNETTSTPVTQETLSLDTIVYDDLGDVVISGRGSSDGFVRVYLDNKPTDVQKVTDSGQWKITLPDVPEGLYALRVDSVNNAGAVTERVQSPFKREAAQTVVASIDVSQPNITIQPGYTLWALAEKRYGSGVLYVQIFEANRDRIKDPDLIYPGQVFDLPN
ncbi:MAG: LysM peptidoglycan-binding domain-containing protein, partial [Amylibacter sp.]